MADCALMGPMYAHLYRDPYSGKILHRRAPRVCRWIETMLTSPETSLNTPIPDIVPSTMIKVLAHLNKDFVPTFVDALELIQIWLEKSTLSRVPRYVGSHSFTIGRQKLYQTTGRRSLHPFEQWKIQRLQKAIAEAETQSPSEAQSFLSKAGASPLKNISINIFNKYFGGSMSGLVFQEIREFRSLAYSAGGTYRKPFFFDRTGRFEGYMGTQADKTIDAIETYMNLLEEMPEKANRMAGIKSGMLQSLTSSRSNFRGIGSTIATWRKQGFIEDPKIMQKEVYENAEFEDLIKFYKEYIQDKPHTIAIVGNKEKIDFNKLSSYGNIIELKKEDIFN